jgi:hypothetical protein
MYQVPPNLNDLRQGDILAGFPFPILDFQRLVIHAQQQLGQASVSVVMDSSDRKTGLVQFRDIDVMIVSQCCDLVEGRSKFISLAAVRSVTPDFYRDTEKDKQRIERLRQSNIVDEAPSARNQYVQSFYLSPLRGVMDQESFVDFSTITSFRLTNRASLLSIKRMQLSDEARSHLKRKVAYFFARPETAQMEVALDAG